MKSSPNTDKSTVGVIICDHGSRRAESNDSLKNVAKRFAGRFSEESRIVEHAHMELAMPDIATA